MKRHDRKRPQTLKERTIGGSVLLVLGLFVTIQGFRAYNSRGGWDASISAYAEHNDAALIAVAAGILLCVAAIYQFAAAAVGYGVKEGRAAGSQDQAGH